MCTNQSETAESGSGKNKSRRRSNGGKCARVHFDSHAGKNGPRWIHAARRRRQQPRRIVQHPPRKIDAKKEVDTARRRAYLFFVAFFRGAFLWRRFPWAAFPWIAPRPRRWWEDRTPAAAAVWTRRRADDPRRRSSPRADPTATTGSAPPAPYIAI